MYRYDRLVDTSDKDAGGVEIKPPEQPATPGTQAPVTGILPQPVPPLTGTLASDGMVGDTRSVLPPQPFRAKRNPPNEGSVTKGRANQLQYTTTVSRRLVPTSLSSPG